MKTDTLPTLLTPTEVANLLRTSKAAVYAKIERGQLPGVVRIGRRVLIREAEMVEWLRRNTAPSLEG
jgi:excisionase family DNA binding protein